MPQLTPNQQAALARDKNIAVTAGAGTGKTRILVDRYVDILLNEDVEVKELLAITFTNKAASEMRERVTENIIARLDSESNAQKRKKLTYLHNHLSSAQISTIHALCARLLREFPLESGNLDPGFRQVDNFEMDLLIDTSITEEIKSIDPGDADWLDLFRLFGPHNIRMMLQKSMNYRFELIRTNQRYQNESQEIIFESLQNQFFDLIQEEFPPSFLEPIQSLSSSLFQLPDSQQNPIDKKEAILRVIKEFCAIKDRDAITFWRNLYIMTDNLTTKVGGAYKSLSQFGGKSAWRPEEADVLLQISKALVPVAAWKKNAISTWPDRLDRVVLQNLFQFNKLYQNVDGKYGDKKRQLAAVDYEDLQLMTLNLLENHEEIRNQIAARYKYIMVDEFQDTNRLQWDIISSLGETNSNKFFIVGDPKQSIYGFRAADVRVFNRVKREFAAINAESDHLLYESFRFKQTISQFVNYIFPEILQLSKSNPWDVGYETIEPKREDSAGGQVEFALLDKADEDDVQAVFIANRIIDILATTEYKAKDIAIIMRSRTHLAEIEKYLREYDIPFRTLGGIGFYQGQEIYDVYHLLKFLITPTDDLALIGVLRSPFADLSDLALFHLSTREPEHGYWQDLANHDQLENWSDDDKRNLDNFIKNADRWINRRDRIGLYEFLTDIFSTSLYRSIVSADLRGDQILANIEKILNYSLSFEKTQSGSIVDFTDSLKYLINRHQKEGEAVLDLSEDNTVKIMTIHQSKGLEYPLVFLPFLEQSSGSSPSQSIYFDESIGAVGKIKKEYILNNGSNSDSCFIYDLLKFKQKRKDLAEFKRLFYVGCTRAKDHLILGAQLKSNKILADTPLSWLMASINHEADELPDGWIQLEDDLKILIHRSYEVKPTSQDRNRQNTLNALQDLSNIRQSSDILNSTHPAFTATTDKPQNEIFSATQLLTFKQDKREYAQRYHLGYFETDYEKIGLGEIYEENALIRGTLVHKMMEHFPDFDLDDLLSEMDIADENLILDLKKEVNLLKDIVQKSTVIKPVLESRNFKNEISILRQLGDDYLTGTLDKIYQDEQGQWSVIDYKTNRIGKKDVDAVAKRYAVQMNVYALLLQSLFPEQNTYNVGLYFINADEIFTETYSKDLITSCEQEFEVLLEEIKQYYPYTPKMMV